MSNYEPTEVEGTDLDDRDVRALTEYLTVLDDVGRARGGEDLYLVVSQSGSEYLVDARLDACECPDAEHRDPDGGCKHARRVAFATRERALPAWIDADDVAGELGEQLDTEPRRAVADGGRLFREGRERQRVPVAGGVLVYEDCPDEIGRRLVGFREVESFTDLREALAARGHSPGDVHHKPVLDDSAGGADA